RAYPLSVNPTSRSKCARRGLSRGDRRMAAIASVCLLSTGAAGCRERHIAPERHLVFVRATTPANAAVWIADENGRHARRLTRGYKAVVSPDGRTVAVGRGDGIHLVSSDGQDARRVTT